MKVFLLVLLFTVTYLFAFNLSATAAEGETNTAKELSVEIISPKEGERVHGNITIEAWVNHPDAVEYCEFYIQEPGAKDRYSWKDYSPPYFWGGDGQTLDTVMLDDGQASAVSHCYPKDTQSAMFQKRAHFIIDNGKPKVKIISPKDDDNIHGNIFIRANAIDPKGIKKEAGLNFVSFYLDGQFLQRLSKSPFEILVKTCLLMPGLHSIRAVVEDSEGFIGSDSLMISLDQKGSLIVLNN
jgi:hypothetical protein